MRFNTMFVLLILSCLGLALAQTTYEDCCFKYVKTMSRRIQKHAVEYRKQVVDGGCNIPAVIFTMKRGLELCADPKEKWVRALIKNIQRKKTKKH